MAGSLEAFDRLVEPALESSHLAVLSAAARDRLCAGSLRSEAPAGRILYYAGDRPAPGLVVSGLVRVFVTSGEGRQVTVAYVRAGGLFGVVEQITGEAAPGSVQALTDARLLRFRASVFDEALRGEPELALAVARYAAACLFSLVAELRGTAFSTVRQRIARHLLDLAAEHQQGALLVAPVTQQQVADAVGSVREVVARALGGLRTDGLVASSCDGLVITDPERLRAEGWPGA